MKLIELCAGSIRIPVDSQEEGIGGYSVNGVARKLLNKGVKGFVQKPYHSIQFAKIVREILDQ